jgi:hypothetical protein
MFRAVLILTLMLTFGMVMVLPSQAFADDPAPPTVPASSVMATIVVAEDAEPLTFTPIKSSQWWDGTDWTTAALTLDAGSTYYLSTPISGFNALETATLPNIKADVSVEIDPAVTKSSLNFLRSYAQNCTKLTSLTAPDLSHIISIPDTYFMGRFAQGCTSLTSLTAPDLSHLTSISGTYFMAYYAQDCTSLTSLAAPNTSALVTPAANFLSSYARGCTSLTSLGIPDTSALGTPGNNLMSNYASDCISLERLNMSSAPGYFASTNVNWAVPSTVEGLKASVPVDYLGAWRALTDSGKTLAINQVTVRENVIAANDAQAPDANDIIVQTAANGEIIANPTSTIVGDTVTLTTVPASGYRPSSIVVTLDGGDTIIPTAAGPNKFTFTMPATNVTVTSTFEPMLDPVPVDGVIATVRVASDATPLVTPKAMTKGSMWSVDGVNWLSIALSPVADTTYYIFTPLSGMGSSNTAILPNVKADVTVRIDPNISTVGNYFLYSYAYNCSSFTSLGAPDTSNISTIGSFFLKNYAYGCINLTSLEVPNTSQITTLAADFLYSYAQGCTKLTSLGAPDTSNITTSDVTTAANFLRSYASGCTVLTSLGIPDTTNMTFASLPGGFMTDYATNCNALNRLYMSSGPGYFANLAVNWNVPPARLNNLKAVVPGASYDAWTDLVAANKTLYLNQIRTLANVVNADSLLSVNNTGGSATTTYAATTIDLSDVEGLFTLDGNAGVPTYSIETTGDPTGVGTIGTGGILTVTKAGTFTIGLVTAATDTHNAGEKVTAILTVNKASQAAPSSLGKTDATASGASDGKITGLTASTDYEYDKDASGSYLPATSNESGEITGLAAGSYVVRLAATDLYSASPDSDPVIIGPVAATYALSGTVDIDGTAEYNETLTANTTALTSTPETDLGELTYQWRRGVTVIGGNSATYTLVAADIGQEITVTVAAANCTGSATSPSTGAVGKASQAAPTGLSATDATANGASDGSITGLAADTAYEYSKDSGSYLAVTSSASGTITGLAAGSYTVRLAETDLYRASDDSTAVIVGQPAPTYQIALPTGITYGTVTSDVATAAANATVTLTVTPIEGWQLEEGSLVVEGEDNSVIAVTKATDTTYTFTMPAQAVIVSVNFEEIPSTGPTITVGTVTALAGDTNVRVPVTITGNPGFTALSFALEFSEANLTLMSIEKGSLLDGDFFADNTSNAPYGFGSIFLGDENERDKNIEGNGEIAVLIFTVAGNAQPSTNLIVLSNRGDDRVNFVNAAGDPLDGTFIEGSIEVTTQRETTVDDLVYNVNDWTGITYNGEPKEVSVEPNTGVGAVTVHYSSSTTNPPYSSTTPPTNAGTYLITVDVADSENGIYAGVTGLELGTLIINKASAPSITWPTASSIFSGQTLSESILSGGSTAYGSFAWQDGTGKPEAPGGGYPVVFTPSYNLDNYEALAPADLIQNVTVLVTYRLGDVDGSGVVTALDAQHALQAAVGLTILSGQAFTAADIDGNGIISAQDALNVLRLSINLPPVFGQQP